MDEDERRAFVVRQLSALAAQLMKAGSSNVSIDELIGKELGAGLAVDPLSDEQLDSVISDEYQRVSELARRCLSTQTWRIFEARYRDAFSIAEIAQREQVTNRTIQRHLSFGYSRKLETFGVRLCGRSRSEPEALEDGFRAHSPFPHGHPRGSAAP
jgi:DNA-directed RNA polymerase specialized sigma24 family protein